jgi:septum formation protein
MRIVLASKSPRRQELLRRIGIRFEVIPSNADEDSVPKDNPAAYVRKLARLKARTVANKVRTGIVIGADTVVYCGGRIIGKPADRKEAARILRLLGGRTHDVMTGVCIIEKPSGRIFTKVVSTTVKFRRMNPELIDWYLRTKEYAGHAGGYAIQGYGGLLVEWIRGDYYNVVGLPLLSVVEMLERAGVKLQDIQVK